MGGKEEAEDAGMVKDGDMEVRLLLLLYDSDAEDALPASYVSSASSLMKMWSIFSLSVPIICNVVRLLSL